MLKTLIEARIGKILIYYDILIVILDYNVAKAVVFLTEGDFRDHIY